MIANNTENDILDIGFKWWTIWAWLGLTLGSISIFVSLAELVELLILFLILNAVLMIMILRFNKYAFLIATVLSLNPIIWIINGIYLKKPLEAS